MRKLGFVCLALLLAAGALGVVYSSWSQNLNTNATVSIAQAPAVVANGANAGTTSATLNGSLTQVAPGNAPVLVGFQYWKDGDSGNKTTVSVGSISSLNSTFSTTITSLTPGITYDYQSTGVGFFTVNSAISTFVTNSTLAITTSSLPNGTVGVPYSQTLQATGGSGSYTTWTISPSLTNGLTLHNGNIISGTPTTAGLVSFTVQVTDSAGTTSPGANLTIVINAAPFQLVFGQQPSSTTIGTAFSSNVTVRVLDSSGALVTASSALITLSITGNPPIVTLSGMQTVNAVNGIATFNNLSINQAGTYSLTATSGSFTVTSNSFSISTPGTTNQLSLETAAGGTGSVITAQSLTAGAGGTVLAYAIERNASGGFVANVAGTWSLSNITGGLVNIELGPAGDGKSATFTDTAPHLAGSATIHIVWDGMSADSGTITVGPALANKLAFGVQPAMTTAGSAINPVVTVIVEDQYGNTVTGDGSTVAISSSTTIFTGGSTLSVTALNGVAAFSNLQPTTLGFTNTLTASDGSLAGTTSNTFTVNPLPTVSSISPSSGTTYGGTPVTITGTYFTGATVVKFGPTAAASFTVNSATSITVFSPPGSAGIVDVTVTAPGGTSITSSADQFTYVSGLYVFTNNNGTGNSNWNTAGNWSSGIVPSSSISVEIQANCTVNAAATCSNMAIDNGITLTVGAFTLGVTGTTTVGGGTSGTLAISSATGTKTFTGAVTINSGGAITETAAATLSFGSDIIINTGGTITEKGAAIVSIAGNLTNNGTYTASTGVHTFSGATKTIGGTNTVTIPTATFTGAYANSGTLTVATLLTVASPGILSNNGTITATSALSGTGTLTNGATGTLNIGGTSGIIHLTATAAGNTVNYTGAVQTVFATNYYNLGLSGTGAKTTTGITVNGVLIYGGPAAVTISAVPTYGTNATLQYSKTAAITSGVEWPATFNSTGGVIIGGTGAITINAAKTVGWTTSVSGTLTIANTGTDTFIGAVTINSGGKITETTAATLSFGSDITINGTFTDFGATTISIAGTLSGTGVLTNVANATLNISGACSITTIANAGTITITGSGDITTALANFTNTDTLNLNGSGTITGITNNAGGIVNLASSGTITSFSNATATSTLNISALTVPTITTLTVSTAGNTVNYNGAGAQIVIDVPYSNLTISGSGTKTWTEGAARVMGGNLQIGDGTTLSVAGGFAWTVTGTTTIGNVASGILSITNATGTKTFTGAVTINSGGIWNETGAAAVNFAGSLANNGTYTASTGIHTFSGATKTITGTISIPSVAVTGTCTNNGTLTIGTALSGAGKLTNGASGTLYLGGTCIVTTLSNAGNMTITGAGAISTALANFTNTDTLNLNGSGTITGITNNAGGIVNLNSSGTIASFNNATSNSTLNISGTVPTINTLTATTAGNIVNYTGAAQTVKGTTYNNLTLGGSDTKTLGAATVTNGSLTVGSGVTLAMSFLLTLNGDLINNGGTTSGSGGVTIAGTATQSIDGFTTTGTITISKTAGTATLNGITSGAALLFSASGATLSISSYLTILGAVTLNNAAAANVTAVITGAGTLNCTSIAVGNGTAATSNTTTYTHTLTSTIASFIDSGNLTINSYFTATNRIRNGVFNIGSGNVTVNGSVTTANANASNVSTLSMATGTQNGTLTLGGGTPFTISGTGTTTITLNGTSSTVNYSYAGSQAVRTTTYYNLILSGSGVKTISTAASGTLATGNLTIDHTGGATALVTNTGIVVNTLNLDGTSEIAGTWGYGPSNPPANQNTTYFANTTGYLTVAP